MCSLRLLEPGSKWQEIRHPDKHVWVSSVDKAFMPNVCFFLLTKAGSLIKWLPAKNFLRKYRKIV